MKILVVDDEKLLVKGSKFNLENEGYQVETAFDGAAAVELARSESFDLIILDLMMPEVDGLTACMRIREFSAVPIIMLTARSEDADKIMGFACGADDYVTKPFNILELKARIRALLRRQGAEVNELSYGNTALDLSSGTLVCGEKQLRLSAREFDVMRYLLQMKGQNVSKEAILARVWGFDSNAVENHVEVYVGFLRKKLKAIGSNVHIEAARRLGYHLEVEGA